MGRDAVRFSNLSCSYEGWHIHDNLPLTFANYRWVIIQYGKRLPAEFYIQPVDILSPAVVTCNPSPISSPIARDSQESVSPGDYCIFNLGTGFSKYLLAVSNDSKPTDGSHIRPLSRNSYYNSTLATWNRSLKMHLGSEILTLVCAAYLYYD